MKIYIHDKGVVLAGKVWEIRRKLKEYATQHAYLKDWINDPANNRHRTD